MKLKKIFTKCIPCSSGSGATTADNLYSRCVIHPSGTDYDVVAQWALLWPWIINSTPILFDSFSMVDMSTCNGHHRRLRRKELQTNTALWSFVLLSRAWRRSCTASRSRRRCRWWRWCRTSILYLSEMRSLPTLLTWNRRSTQWYRWCCYW